MSHLPKRTPSVALGVTFACFAAATLAMFQADTLVGISVTSALEERTPSAGMIKAALAEPELDPAHLRLSSLPAGPTVNLTRVWKVGDRISIASAESAEQTLEVVDVRPLAVGAGDAQGVRFLLVTARPAEADGRAVRFIVEDMPVEPTTPRPQAKQPRAL